jgi:hypothetical protein
VEQSGTVSSCFHSASSACPQVTRGKFLPMSGILPKRKYRQTPTANCRPKHFRLMTSAISQPIGNRRVTGSVGKSRNCILCGGSNLSEPKPEPESVKEKGPSSDAKERIKANARRAAELNAEREKEKKAKAGSKSGE